MYRRVRMLALLIGATVVAPAAAKTTALLNVEDDGHDTLVMFQNGSSSDAMLSFSCTPGKNTFGVSMAMPGHETWPLEGTTVAVKAGTETLRTQRFSTYGKYLVWGGDQARATFQQAITMGSVTVSVEGADAVFSFDDIRPQISRYRELCGLK